MRTEPLAEQDATLWCAQAPDSPLQIGALCLFEAAPLVDADGRLRLDALRRRIGRALIDHPRLRRRLTTRPLDEAPAWVEDGDVDLTHHVVAVALPRPGGDRELRDLVGRLIETPLPTDRPLWRIWVIEGLAGDRVALLPTFSHVLADGMGVLAFALSVLTAEPIDEPIDEPTDGPTDEPTDEPIDEPTGAGGSDDRADPGARIIEDMRRTGEVLVDGFRLAVRPDRVARRALALGRAVVPSVALAPRLPITGPVGPHRDFVWVQLPLEELLEVHRDRAVTLNDVVLAVTAGAVRAYVDGHDGPLDAPARVLVPVSTHDAGTEDLENHFSFLLADLPVDRADPLDRLAVVSADMARTKASAQVDLAPLLFSLGGWVPARLLRLVGPPLVARQPFVNLAVTNLPGTRDPLYLLGAELLELYPYVGVTGNIAVIVGVISYGDALGLGITVDAGVVPDADRLADAFRVAARDLITASRAAGPAGSDPAQISGGRLAKASSWSRASTSGVDRREPRTS